MNENPQRNERSKKKLYTEVTDFNRDSLNSLSNHQTYHDYDVTKTNHQKKKSSQLVESFYF